MQLSVITSTWNRPQQLAHCLEQFHRQSLGGMVCEHWVVSDGPDPRAAELATSAGACYFELPETGGLRGAVAKDVGLGYARGEYVCFWDDDNYYESHALAVLYATAAGHDLGLVQIRHLDQQSGRLRIVPEQWSGTFELGHVDTMCVCVRRTLAVAERWSDAPEPRNTDYHWLRRLTSRPLSIHFAPVIVGVHL